MTTLITFLGRAMRKDGVEGYSSVAYAFPDGSVREGPFFGLCLCEHLRPDRLVVLGTSGSMWDALVEYMARGEGDTAEQQRVELYEAAAAQAVTEKNLESLRPLIERASGIECDFRLIPYARDLEEQTNLLEQIRASVGSEEDIHFDITHGLRHLPVVSLVACQYLEALTQKLRVQQVWYGALDVPRAGGAPARVIELEGVRRLQRWVQALEQFDRRGDYARFADLLQDEGHSSDMAKCLREAAFFETVGNLARTRDLLQTFLKRLEDEPLRGAAQSFEPHLRERFDWVRKESNAAHQARLAQQYLESGDYLRAAIFAHEMVITRWMEERWGGDARDFEQRSEANEDMKKNLKESDHPLASSFDDIRRLRDLRNAMAHALPPKKIKQKERKLLKNPNLLRDELERIIKKISS